VESLEGACHSAPPSFPHKERKRASIYINIKLKTFYRIAINLCMDLGDKESFMKIWEEIGLTIYSNAEKYGQQLNDAHKRQSGTKKVKK
jgi:hypothetical protein